MSTRQGNFHTLANLSQTLNAIILQHYTSVHKDDNGNIISMPNFVAEAIKCMCFELGCISNGNPLDTTSWENIKYYADEVSKIIQQIDTIAKKESVNSLSTDQEKQNV